jgi:hypothetical protein
MGIPVLAYSTLAAAQTAGDCHICSQNSSSTSRRLGSCPRLDANLVARGRRMILPTCDPKEAEASNVSYSLHARRSPSSIRPPASPVQPRSVHHGHVPPQLVPPALDVINFVGILADCPRCFSSLYIGVNVLAVAFHISVCVVLGTNTLTVSLFNCVFDIFDLRRWMMA